MIPNIQTILNFNTIKKLNFLKIRFYRVPKDDDYEHIILYHLMSHTHLKLDTCKIHSDATSGQLFYV